MIIGGDGMPYMPHTCPDAGTVAAPEQVPDMMNKGAYPGNPVESAMMAKVGEKCVRCLDDMVPGEANMVSGEVRYAPAPPPGPPPPGNYMSMLQGQAMA